MAEHDYVIANASGATVRSDLNSCFAAIVSQNSKSSEPTTKYAYMWWVDTSTNPDTLKQRNAANDAWLTIGTISANLGLASPSAANVFTDNQTLDNQKSLRFSELDSNGAHYMEIKAPAAVTANKTLTLPDGDGAAGQALVDSDGSGTLGWSTLAALSADNTWTGAQRGTITALTDGATITPDFSASNDYSVTLGGNRTFANPTNITAGQSGTIYVTQDGTGSRTLAWGSYWHFPGGSSTAVLSTAANSVDAIAYTARTTTSLVCVLIKDTKD